MLLSREQSTPNSLQFKKRIPYFGGPVVATCPACRKSLMNVPTNIILL